MWSARDTYYEPALKATLLTTRWREAVFQEASVDHFLVDGGELKGSKSGLADHPHAQHDLQEKCPAHYTPSIRSW